MDWQSNRFYQCMELGDEGICPIGKLLCLWQIYKDIPHLHGTFHTCLTIGPIQLFIFFYGQCIAANTFTNPINILMSSKFQSKVLANSWFDRTNWGSISSWLGSGKWGKLKLGAKFESSRRSFSLALSSKLVKADWSLSVGGLRDLQKD